MLQSVLCAEVLSCLLPATNYVFQLCSAGLLSYALACVDKTTTASGVRRSRRFVVIFLGKRESQALAKNMKHADRYENNVYFGESRLEDSILSKHVFWR